MNGSDHRTVLGGRGRVSTTSGELDRVTGAQGRVWIVGYPALLYTDP